MWLLWVALPLAAGQNFLPPYAPPATNYAPPSSPFSQRQPPPASVSFASPQRPDLYSRRTEAGPPRTIQLARRTDPVQPPQQQQLPPQVEPGTRFGGDETDVSFHLNIGTFKGGKNVVEDDMPTTSFRRDSSTGTDNKDPLFSVPSKTLFTTFYVSRADHPVYNNARLLAQRANIVVEGRDVSAKLAQTWVMIDEVPSENNASAPPLTFTIQYECFNAGTPEIQVKLRLFQLTTGTDGHVTRAIKEVTFQYTKQCENANENRGTGNANPGFHVGTIPTSVDVMEDGMAKPQFSLGMNTDSVFTVPTTVDKMDFWIRGPPNVMMNAPFVYTRNQQVLTAQGVGLDDAQVFEANKAYPYTIKFHCTGAGESMLTVVFSAKTPTFRRTFFTFKKVCTQPVAVAPIAGSGVVIQGFSVSAKWGGEPRDLVSNGTVHEQFKPSATDDMEENLQRPTIPADISEVRFVVRLTEPNLKLKFPWVRSFPFKTTERINKPRVNVDKKKFKRASVDEPGEFSVVFNCKGEGLSNNVISLRISGAEVSFVIRKECGDGDVTTATKAEETLPEPTLYKITGFNIGTHKFGTDVVKDGIPQKKYDWETPWQDVHVVGVNSSFLTFFIWRNKTADPRPLRLDTPELSSTLEISEPQIAGSGSDGDVIDPERPTSFITVNFHCMKEGTTHFNLVIPFLPYEEEQKPYQLGATPEGRRRLKVRVAADEEEDEEEEEEEVEVEDEEEPEGEVAPATKPKKQSRTRSKKVVPTPEPIVEPKLKKKTRTKKLVEEEEEEEEEEPAPKKKKNVVLDSETEETMSKKKKKKPAGEEEGEVDGQVVPIASTKKSTKKKPKKVYQEAPVRPLSEPIRDVPIRLTFIKHCPAPSEAPQQKGLGGIFIPGLTVCSQKDCANDSYVVYNGFPLTAYFGQRTVRDPQWKIVSEEEVSTDLYISYKPASEDEEEYNDVVEFDAPIIIKDNTIASPELSGEAMEGGTLAKDGEELELGITYNCEFQGLVAVTVMLPIIPHGAITFTFPKQCRGATKFVGVRLPGLRIGMASGEADVVLNGFTQEQFQPFLAHETTGRKRVFEDSTTFYISHLAGRPVKMLEPTVFAHRGIANPYISHDMHVSKGRTEAEDLDLVVVGKEEQTFDVIYNCLFDDETAITVSFPLVPKGRVSFTWVKVCGQDNDDDDFFTGIHDDEISLWNLEDDEFHNIGQQDAGTWDQWDEVRWNPDLEQTSQREGEAAIGYVDIGTSSKKADVCSGGVAFPEYALPTDDSEVKSATIGRGSNLATYYISVPHGFQQIGAPVFRVLRGNNGQDIVLPKLTGTAMVGRELRVGEPPAVLTVEFNCQAPGFTPVLITVPLVPANLGSVGFRIVKICGSFDKNESFAFTASNVLALLAGITLIVAVCLGLIYKQGKSSEPKYSRVMQRDVTPDKIN